MFWLKEKYFATNSNSSSKSFGSVARKKNDKTTTPRERQLFSCWEIRFKITLDCPELKKYIKKLNLKDLLVC